MLASVSLSVTEWIAPQEAGKEEGRKELREGRVNEQMCGGRGCDAE